jgi:hypothetical protein
LYTVFGFCQGFFDEDTATFFVSSIYSLFSFLHISSLFPLFILDINLALPGIAKNEADLRVFQKMGGLLPPARRASMN